LTGDFDAVYIETQYMSTTPITTPMIDPNLKRGSAELAVLSVLSAGALHGYEIARRIKEQTGGVLAFDLASLYPLLYRLEKDELLSAEWEESASGRKRRCYQLTGAGRARLAPLRAQWKEFFGALDRLTGFGQAFGSTAFGEAQAEASHG